MGRKKGSVSLFTAMIFLLVVSVITTTITSARVQASQVMVSTALNMGLDSVFSSYDVKLFSEFGVLLLDGSNGGTGIDTDIIAGNISEYMSYNLDTGKDLYLVNPVDLYGITLNGISVNRAIAATSNSGLVWQNMAVEYEKYAKPISLAAEYLGYEDMEEESRIVDEVSEKIMDCTETILKINTEARRLVEHIDGVKCDESGINLEKLSTVSNFVKKFAPNEITADNLNIENQTVFAAVKDSCISERDYLANAINYANKEDVSAAKKEIEKLKSDINENLSVINTALGVISDIENTASDFNEEISGLKSYINSNSEVLSDEVFDGLLEETESIKNYNEIIAEDVINISLTKESLYSNQNTLNNALTLIDKLDYEMEESNLIAQMEMVSHKIEKITFNGMTIQYDRLTGSGGGETVLDMLENFFDEGVLMFIIPDGSTISGNSISKEGLPSKSCDFSGAADIQEQGNLATVAAKRIIYTEYVLDNFASFVDEDSGNSLNYEAEYILYGNNSDRKNLADTAKSIALMRSGLNMLYVITDSAKKNQAYTLALTLVGFTGIDAVVRLVQYALLYLWSYAEGLADVRTLLSGGNVPLKKSAENWQLSLDNLMNKEINASNEDKGGFDYENYLRILFYAKDDGVKAGYTMDLVQLFMQHNYNENFKMENYVYGVEVAAGYALSGLNSTYSEYAAYTY